MLLYIRMANTAVVGQVLVAVKSPLFGTGNISSWADDRFSNPTQITIILFEAPDEQPLRVTMQVYIPFSVTSKLAAVAPIISTPSFIQLPEGFYLYP